MIPMEEGKGLMGTAGRKWHFSEALFCHRRKHRIVRKDGCFGPPQMLSSRKFNGLPKFKKRQLFSGSMQVGNHPNFPRGLLSQEESHPWREPPYLFSSGSG
jgi:hypothetical protein